ncbi:MAG: helix-turn-helix domain-containing protein [Candidatus Aenigmarchaeota archaeon]|nr:helix-turn-helix domain-containing protein [Candidatus Aenigmarchaeota archaeon]
MDGHEELLTLDEVARRLRVPPATLKRWSALGRFPRLLRLSRRHYRVRAEDLDAWLDGRWTEPADQLARQRLVIRQPAFAGAARRRRAGTDPACGGSGPSSRDPRGP